ncbi:type IV pili methyl-accepting chemotaxis transducer N-terminal domain-containing protein [Yoonia sp. BS5-3]|uniref:Type IV pili methyl-accepting chemotaxis transducer N-terminal domain-containing protein n=1 Tax=Yoonia phaeophyticola TaxID=3137369 RepID=A0ABZ2V6E6_9RHOB
MLRLTQSAPRHNGFLALSSIAIMTTFLCSAPAIGQEAATPDELIDVNYVIESDGADRILLAGKLRTLTQQVAAASCSVTSGIDVVEAHDVLEQATAEFDRYIAALRDGDEELHILGPEEDARIVRDLEHVLEEWSAIHSAIDAVIADSNNVDAAHVIDDHNLELLDLTTILSSDISGRYAHPYEMTAADAMMIEIAGRQLMLTQKMAKDSCEIWTGYHSEEAKEDLVATMAVFETSLNALRYGMPDAGLQAAPNDVIRTDLDLLLSRWDIVKINQQRLVDGEELNEEQKTEIFHDLLVELADLEHLLDDYKEHAERAH